MSIRAAFPTRATFTFLLQLIPGLLLSAILASLGITLHMLPILRLFSPLILSILFGAVFHNVVRTPEDLHAGIVFSRRHILRLGIVLLGLQITVPQVMSVGISGVAILTASLVATMVFTKVIGRWLSVDPRLSILIAAGTSICGASAIMAVDTVIKARDEDVTYAVACITILGSVAMFLYPLVGAALQLSANDYGLWSGASIHEVAQVIAAAFQRGGESGQFATVAKLARVIMLAPMVLILGTHMLLPGQARRNEGDMPAAAPMPWFVLGFLTLVGVNSWITISPTFHSIAVVITNFLLAMALAAMGLGTDFRKLVAAGPRPLLLGTAAALFISCFSLALILLARLAETG